MDCTTDDPRTTCSDALANYEIHHEIGRGSTSVVYLATCRKGRMRNRQVALKKIVNRTDSRSEHLAHLRASTALHHTLFHPSIVSLLSTLATSSASYHVLELCPKGTLHDFLHSRNPPTLTEAELRGVLKSVVAAVSYLHKRNIVHRDIKPSNILLGDDFRVKLADFGLAVQLASVTSTSTTFCGSPNYVSPEVVEGVPYGLSTDLWSLGSLIVTCLSGIPAFEAPTPEHIFSNIIRGTYILPDTVSYEARDLVSGLLQKDPAHRIPLHRILSHPFFNPALPVSALTLTTPSSKSVPPPPSPPFSVVVQRPPHKLRRPTGLRKPSTPDATGTDTWRPPAAAPAFSRPARRVFSDPTSTARSDLHSARLRSVSSYSTLRQEDSAHRLTKRHAPPVSDFGSARTRTFSPAGAPTPALTTNSALSSPGSGSGSDSIYGSASDSGTSASAAGLAAARHHAKERNSISRADHARHAKRLPSGDRDPVDDALAAHPLLLPPKGSRNWAPPRTGEDDCEGPRSGLRSQGGVPQRLPDPARPAEPTGRAVGPRDAQPKDRGADGNTAAETAHVQARVNTTYLVPKTHKLAGGSVTVLPSRSLLVDLREGERRKGRRGDAVLVVGADGATVKVYAAPHLSTPCCLAEPLAEYGVAGLPQVYAAQYADAVRVVEKLKRRIPKMVLHEPEAQYTLMANEPFGDIEITAPRPDAAAPTTRTATERAPQTTLRLVRAHRTLEIVRGEGGAGPGPTGAWTRVVLPTLGHGWGVRVPREEHAALDAGAREAVGMLSWFLRVCGAVDGVRKAGCGVADVDGAEPYGGAAPTPKARTDRDGDEGYGGSGADDAAEVHSPALTARTHASASSGSTALPLRGLRVGPRPAKFAGTAGSSLGSVAGNAADSRRSWLQ